MSEHIPYAMRADKDLKRYHKDVKWSWEHESYKFVDFWMSVKGFKGLKSTEHFEERQAERGISFPTFNNLLRGEVVELYKRESTQLIEKLVVRCKGRGKDDFTYVISKEGHIVTAWVSYYGREYHVDVTEYEH